MSSREAIWVCRQPRSTSRNPPIRRIGALSATIPGLISLSAGYPAPDMFPWDDIESITAQILARHDGNTLQYGATRGYRPLIEQLIANTLQARGISDALRRRDHHQRIAAGPRPGRPRDDRSGRSRDRRAADLQRRDRGVSQPAGVAGRRAAGRARASRLRRSTASRPTSRSRAGRAKFIYVTPNFQNPAGPADERAAAARITGRRAPARSRHPRRRSVRVDLLRGRDHPRRYAADQGRRYRRARDLPRAASRRSWCRACGWRGWSRRRAWRRRSSSASRPPISRTGVFDQRIVHGALAGGVIDRIAPGLRAHYQAKRTRDGTRASHHIWPAA